MLWLPRGESRYDRRLSAAKAVSAEALALRCSRVGLRTNSTDPWPVRKKIGSENRDSILSGVRVKMCNNTGSRTTAAATAAVASVAGCLFSCFLAV